MLSTISGAACGSVLTIRQKVAWLPRIALSGTLPLRHRAVKITEALISRISLISLAEWHEALQLVRLGMAR